MEISEKIKLICSKEGQDFIEKNQNENIQKLYLKYHKNVSVTILIDQLQVRKKIAKKLAQWHSLPDIIFPVNVSSEQSSSQFTAKLKASLISGNSLTDLTGGMGVDAYYLSNSFDQIYYYEKQTDLHDISIHNFSILKANNIQCFNNNSTEAIDNIKDESYVYIDPARRDKDNGKLISLSQCEPNVLALVERLLQKNCTVLIKTSPMLDIHLAMKELKFVNTVWIISHRNDCKEVVYTLNKEAAKTVEIKTFNILANQNVETFNFLNNRVQAKIASSLGEFIYEPNASIQKSGGSNALCENYSVEKLHPNTNLFTSDFLVPNFPGKRFSVLQVVKAYEKSLKKKNFNVISRNYPDKASIIEAKLKLRPAKDDYLIACQTSFNNYKFILAQLVP